MTELKSRAIFQTSLGVREHLPHFLISEELYVTFDKFHNLAGPLIPGVSDLHPHLRDPASLHVALVLAAPLRSSPLMDSVHESLERREDLDACPSLSLELSQQLLIFASSMALTGPGFSWGKPSTFISLASEKGEPSHLPYKDKPSLRQQMLAPPYRVVF